MPAISRKQQQAMAIAEHTPGKLYKRNAGMKSMSQQQLHDFASTKNMSTKPKAGHLYSHSLGKFVRQR